MATANFSSAPSILNSRLGDRFPTAGENLRRRNRLHLGRAERDCRVAGRELMTMNLSGAVHSIASVH